MTGYADPSAPRLSDFLMERRATMDDDHWPFSQALRVDLLSGGFYSPTVGRYEEGPVDPKLYLQECWPYVCYGVPYQIFHRQTFWASPELTVSGTVDERKQQVIDALKAKWVAIGLPIEHCLVSAWVSEGSTYRASAPLQMRSQYVDAHGLLGMTAINNYQNNTYLPLITSGNAAPAAGWRDAATSEIDAKIENEGWRVLKPWSTFPQVRPLFSTTGLGQSNIQACDMGSFTDSSWMMGVDYWSLRSHRIGEKVPWVKWVQQQDLRDPNDPNFLSMIEKHAVYLDTATTKRLNTRPSNKPITGWSLQYIVETLDGQRPTTIDEMRTMVGLDQQPRVGVPGCLYTQTNYIDGYYGWMEPTAPNPTWCAHPMRLYCLMTPDATFSFTGVTSMDDMLAQENVKLAYTVEIYPYAEVGPAADSMFEPITFDAAPKVRTRMRLSTVDDIDGGAP